ncbi:hypothetical protein Tco_0791167 [Tanacetum coccineum]
MFSNPIKDKKWSRLILPGQVIGMGIMVRNLTAIGHYKSECPKLKNQNERDQNNGRGARGRAFVLGGGEAI